MDYLFFGFSLIVLFVWSARAQRALKTLLHSPEIRPEEGPPVAVSVTIIVPAKNEEKNIRTCLEGLLLQDHPDFEILVVNDNSTDRTEQILQEMGAARIPDHGRPLGASRLRYLNSQPTPPGWTGKNYALHQAIPHARGEWFLFTDADTRHRPAGLSASLKYAAREKLQLLSLLPRCLTESFCERAIQPSAMGFTGLWFPIEKINDPSDPMVFGNGQYLLIHRDHYEAIGGHSAVRGEFLEDFALVRRTKEHGAKPGVALGMQVFGTRMYGCLGEIWRGWRRIYLHAFQSHPGRLMVRALSVFCFSLLPCLIFPWVLFQSGSFYKASAVCLGISLFIMLSALWKTHGILQTSRRYIILHPAAALCIFLILLDAFRMAVTRQKTVWR